MCKTDSEKLLYGTEAQLCALGRDLDWVVGERVGGEAQGEGKYV